MQDIGKTGGCQCYHIIQSLKPGEVTPELVLQIAKKFAEEYLTGYEVVIGTHVDKNHIHSHLVFNSVNGQTGNSDTILYLGGNESSTHEYISKALGKATIDTRTHGQTKGKSGSYSTNFQQSGRELLTPDEVRMLDNRYAILFIRGAKPVMDLKYELTQHPAIRHTIDGGGPPYIHHQKKPQNWFSGKPLFDLGANILSEQKENSDYEEP